MPSSTLAASPSAHAPERRLRPAEQRFGLGVALVTPFARDGSVDLARLRKHARRVLDEGCASVTLFGTTGEGASLGMTARTPTTAYPMTIFHKPNCSTSRNVLGLIRESGVEPEIVLYLEMPPSKKKLRELATAMGM